MSEHRRRTSRPSRVATARLAAELAAEVDRVERELRDGLGVADLHRRLGEPHHALRAVEDGRDKLAGFEVRVGSLLSSAAVEREAEAILDAVVQDGRVQDDLGASHTEVVDLDRARELREARAVVGRRRPSLSRRIQRASGAAASFAASVTAVAVAAVVGLPGIGPDRGPDIAASPGAASATTEASHTPRFERRSARPGTATSDAGVPAGTETGAGTTDTGSFDPYTLDVRWLFDPTRNLLARLGDHGTSRQQLLREIEALVAPMLPVEVPPLFAFDGEPDTDDAPGEGEASAGAEAPADDEAAATGEPSEAPADDGEEDGWRLRGPSDEESSPEAGPTPGEDEPSGEPDEADPSGDREQPGVTGGADAPTDEESPPAEEGGGAQGGATDGALGLGTGVIP